MEPEKTRIFISLVVVVGFFALVAAFILLPIKGDVAVLNLLVGAVISGFTSVLQYFVGSTSGSKAKDTALSTIATANVPAPPTNVAPIGRTGT